MNGPIALALTIALVVAALAAAVLVVIAVARTLALLSRIEHHLAALVERE